MNKVIQYLQLNFLPHSVDAGLLILRLWFGLSLFLLHGKGKLMGFSTMSQKFPPLFGLSSSASLSMAIFTEVVAALLLVVGLFTRLAALNAVITFAVAFFIVHKASLASGPGSGEPAFVYLAVFVTLLVAGPGRFSLDAMLNRSAAARTDYR